MRLKLPHSLHYPITVTELLKRPDDDVERSAPLFTYSYKTTVTEIDRYGDEHQVEKTFPTRFESSVDGTLKRWFLERGTVIAKPGFEVAEIEEPCTHSVQYGGMCVTCGKDMTELSYATTQVDAKRAQINMIHDNNALTVSQEEATKVEEEAKRRLIASKKLSLVVDLDQTIIHATVDPTVGEWQKDPANPNYEAVKDVQSFQLVDDGPGGRGTCYYIKLRPGLKEFLEKVSRLYELHIYTMGTRTYAQHIAQLVDPDRKVFGDRILSRDESGSMVAKNLQRLFPVDTKMVVIIDDRGDVWNWNANLVKVRQFSFFIGIGDINSSFLPKKPKIRLISKGAKRDAETKKKDEMKSEEPRAPESSTEEAKGTGDIDKDNIKLLSALEQLVSMGGGDDPNTLQEQTAKQDEALAAQLQERPLLQKQKQLDAADEESESDMEKPRSHLLSNDDNELHYLEEALRKVHTEFYEEHSRRIAGAQGGRLAELRGAQVSTNGRRATANTDLDLIPDVKVLMPEVKSRVLSGVTIVFSGVIPLDTDTQSAEMTVWARQFGAKVQEKVSGRHTTHVVAMRNRTAKVRQAVRKGKGRIKVVGLNWLMDCIVQWKRLDETPYLLKTGDADIGKPFPGEDVGDGDDEILSESEDINTDDATESEFEPSNSTKPASLKPPNKPPGVTPRLTISTDYATDDEDMDGVLPGDYGDDNRSPTSEDWKAMKDEMEEFLGSDDDEDDGDDDEEEGGDDAKEGMDYGEEEQRHGHAGDEVSDSESLASKKSATAHKHRPRPMKRTHSQISTNTAGDENEDVSGRSDASSRSRQQQGKRKQPRRDEAKVNGHGKPNPSLDGQCDVPTPADTSFEGVSGNGKEGGGDPEPGGEDADDGWSEFEGDLDAEVERAEKEEQAAMELKKEQDAVQGEG